MDTWATQPTLQKKKKENKHCTNTQHRRSPTHLDWAQLSDLALDDLLPDLHPFRVMKIHSLVRASETVASQPITQTKVPINGPPIIRYHNPPL